MTAPETEAHLQLKSMAAEVARSNGWTVSTEAAGTSPCGEQWRADVLAQKQRRKVAIEVQWSSQTNDEMLQRQERYSEAGIRGLWLIRQPSFPICREFPAARIGGSLEKGFLALIPLGCGQQEVSMRRFLDAVFNKRFRFGVQLGMDAIVSVRAGFLWCWSCGAQTTIITSIDVALGANRFDFTVPELGKHPQVLHSVLSRLPSSLEIGRIKTRFSKTQGRSYVSNGCFHCDALIGQFFEHDAWDEQETVFEFAIRISEQWQRTIESYCNYEETWSVYSPSCTAV